MPIKLPPADQFPNRHIGPDDGDVAAMLKVLGVASLDALIDEVIPPGIRSRRPLALPPGKTEHELLVDCWRLAKQNQL
jgi:glycine dehydrogenase